MTSPPIPNQTNNQSSPSSNSFDFLNVTTSSSVKLDSFLLNNDERVNRSTSNEFSSSNQTDFDKARPFKLKERILSARKIIQDFTEINLRASSSSLTMAGINADDFSPPTTKRTESCLEDDAIPNTSSANKTKMWLRPPSTSKEFFEMGISIFEDNDLQSGIECMINTKLNQVESDLQEILKYSIVATKTSDTDNFASVDEPDKSYNIDENKSTNQIFMDIDELHGGVPLNKEAITGTDVSYQKEAKYLIYKVQFLRKCADARNKIDDSSNSFESNIVHAAEMLVAAEETFHEAELIIKTNTVNNEYSDEDPNLPRNHQFLHLKQEMMEQDVQISNRILNFIHDKILRQRSALHSKASTILDNSLFITNSTIMVKNLPNFSVDNNGNSSIDVAYQVFDLLSKKDEKVLQDVMYTFSSQLYSVVLLNLVKSFNRAKTFPSMFIANEDEKDSEEHITYSCRKWEFTEKKQKEKNMAILNGTHVSIMKLEWSYDKASTPCINDLSSKTYPQKSEEAWSNILQSTTTILNFVSTHVLMSRHKMCSMVGNHLFLGKFSESRSDSEYDVSNTLSSSTKPKSAKDMDGPFLKKLLEILWNSFIPTQPSHVKETGILLSKVSQKFESNLFSKGFIKQSSVTKDQIEADNVEEAFLPICSFSLNLEQKFAEKRRANILFKGRTILLQEDFHNTHLVGIDHEKKSKKEKSIKVAERIFDDDGESVFLLHRCSVSQVASSIMSLAHQTLDEAVSSKSLTSTAPHLYRASRELFDLYRAIIPTLHGSAISTIPRAAAILHNDCIYFAHEMLLLGHKYRERFPSDSHNVLAKMCTFVDFVPVFRETGNKVLVEMIEKQRDQLENLVLQRVGNLMLTLRMNEEVVEWSEAETGVRAAHYHLRHLSMAWINILSQDIYSRAMGSLIDALLNMLLDEVMKAHDISEVASHFIGTLFTNAMKGSELFPDGEKEAKKYCSLWDKFNAVRQFMHMSLANISASLSQGSFRSVTGPELSHLIKAAFDDSEKRRSILLALSSE